MLDLAEGGEVYAFVDAVPSLRGPGARRDILFDAVDSKEFDAGKGGMPGSLWLVRVMSTQERLRGLFQVGELAEGQWYRAKLRKQPGMPIAWTLPAEGDYEGRVTRANLVALERLPMDAGPSRSPPIGRKLAAWCLAASAQACRQPVADALQSSSTVTNMAVPSRMHVRVVDVGHASCAALHVDRDPASQIVGYCDVGRPVFFHAGTAPTGLYLTEGRRVPTTGFVLLSHWDFDHYSMAVSRAMRSLQALNWYAPDQAVGPNAAKLQRDLGSQLSLIGVPHYPLGRGLSLYRGTGPPGDRNGSGYAIRLDQLRDTTLLPGDLGYGLIPSLATVGLTSLVVTHHGGSGGSTPPVGLGVAVVSYGKPNRYGHPVVAELDALRRAGWSVVHTADLPGVNRGDRWLTAP